MDGTLQLIVNIGAAATALAAIVGLPVAIYKLWPGLKRLVTIGSIVETLPELALDVQALAVGQRSQADTLAAQDEKLDKIVVDVNQAVKQVQNSHVTNLRDDVDEVIGKLDTFHDKLDDHLKACPTPTTTVNVEVKP